jgi:hypothetical protein
MVTIVRIAVAAGFLSAVADRFGLWGPPGSPLAAWGDFAHFTSYTAKLLFFLPHSLVPLFAWTRRASPPPRCCCRSRSR